MMSGGAIMALANQQAEKAAKRKLEPRVFFDAADIEQNCGRIPNIGSYRPPGWTLEENKMVDKSGMGDEGEPALTLRGYKQWLSQYLEGSETVGWAIIEEGQFQIVVGRFTQEKQPQQSLGLETPATESVRSRIDRIFEMSMSKKHFISLADMIKKWNSNPDNEPFTERQLELLAHFQEQQNSAFKWGRWMDYVHGTAGPGGGKIRGPKTVATELSNEYGHGEA